MTRKPLTIVEGFRTTLDGVVYLLIKRTDPIPKEIGVKVTEQLFGRLRGYELAVAFVGPDSTLGVLWPPEVATKFRGKKFPMSLLTKVPICPDDLRRAYTNLRSKCNKLARSATP